MQTIRAHLYSHEHLVQCPRSGEPESVDRCRLCPFIERVVDLNGRYQVVCKPEVQSVRSAVEFLMEPSARA